MTMKIITAFLLSILTVGLAHTANCTTLGLLASNPASSCNEVYQHNIASRQTSGYYWIKTDQGLYQIKCKMGLQCGGVEGGWMQVVDVNMVHDNSCPGTWRMLTSPKKLCISGVNSGCESAHFKTRGVSFQHICGRTKAYQKGNPDAFLRGLGKGIDGTYVDGLSITLGSPRQHIWTYANAPHETEECPCDLTAGQQPSVFVENNYYCENGSDSTTKANSNLFYLSDPLWDGDGCLTNSGCCSQLGMPWFYRKTIVPLSENIEVRICKDEPYSDEDTAVEEVEIYVL